MATVRSLRLLAAGALALATLHAQAAMRTRDVDWTVEGKPFRGVLVYDDSGPKARPGLVMVPNWMGVNASAVEKARRMAGRDYVVLVADVYGAGVRPRNAVEAGAAATALKGNPAALRARMQKAVDALKAQAGGAPLDAARIGAFGFCFGGTAVLEFVRSGAALDAAVTLHAGLDTSMRAVANSVKSPLLVLNGAADQGVTRDDVAKLQAEMTGAGADWQFVDFGGAVHCFAEADAGDDPRSNCRYDPVQGPRAWRMMDAFFRERFAATGATSGRG